MLKDPNFDGSVILLCSYNTEGAFGLILNQPVPIPLHIVLESLELPSDIDTDIVCCMGGPVQQEACFVVHSAPKNDHDMWGITPTISVTSSRVRLHDCLNGGHAFRVYLGYAGWGPGQLDEEIESGAWLYSDATSELVFDTDPLILYRCALAELGLTPEQIAMKPYEA
jgi:putative transcriptional regulator